MKLACGCLGAIAALFVVMIVGGVIWLMQPGTQRDLTLRVLESQTPGTVELESVRYGLTSFQLSGLSIDQPDVTLSVDEVDVELSLWALVSENVIRIPALKVVGLRADLSRLQTQTETTEVIIEKRPEPTEETLGAPTSWELFREQVSIPLYLEEIAIDAEVLLPNQRSVTIDGTGGGFAPGAQGSLQLAMAFADGSEGAAVSSFTGEVEMFLEQADPSGVVSAGLRAGGRVAGEALTGPLSLEAQMEAEKTDVGESLRLLVRGTGEGGLPRNWLRLEVLSNPGAKTASGTYEIDVQGEDLARVQALESLRNLLISGSGEFAVRESAPGTVVVERAEGGLAIVSPEAEAGRLDVLYEVSPVAEQPGRYAFSVPVTLQAGQTSDILIEGSVSADPLEVTLVDLASDLVVVGDFQAFAGSFMPEPSDETTPEGEGQLPQPERDATPFWGDRLVEASWDFAKVVLPNGLEAENLSGRAWVTKDELRVEDLAGLVSEGEITGRATLAFAEDAPEPYSLAADLDVAGFDAGAFMRVVQEGETRIKGIFDAEVEARGSGMNVRHLAERAQGRAEVTSTEGVLHLLRGEQTAEARRRADQQRALSPLLGILGQQVGGNVGQGLATVGTVLDLMQQLQNYRYEELRMVVTRGDDLDIVIEDGRVSSELVRIATRGTIDYEPTSSWETYPMDVALDLSARGAFGRVLRQTGRDVEELESGYIRFTEPLVIQGTLGSPDTSELEELFDGLLRNTLR